MKVFETSLEGCYLIEPQLFHDERGFFMEAFNQKKLNKLIGNNINFVQDNLSFSKKNVLRGLHYQTGSSSQAKLVTVLSGKVLDVIVDLRNNSKTFGKHFKIELSSDNNKQLFIPRGFAHGFLVLSDIAVFSYKCDNFYNKDSESGIIFNDSDLAIDWGIAINNAILSEKDLCLPNFNNVF